MQSLRTWKLGASHHSFGYEVPRKLAEQSQSLLQGVLGARASTSGVFTPSGPSQHALSDAA
eukprot:2981300-Pyramimonas_sp.AAC.1